MPKNFVTVNQLLKRLTKPNLIEELDDEIIAQISSRCVQDYETDEESRKEWMDKSSEALELAMQTASRKTFPWDGAANVKYPLLTTAAIQFHARAYPSIIMGNQVVKGQVTGEDPEGTKTATAVRIGKFMSYQLLEEMDGWEEDVDKLLISLPIIGCIFKKTYFDPSTKKNRSDLVFPQNLVINYKTKNLSSASRLTYLFTLYPREIIERQMQGIFDDVDINFGEALDSETPQEMLEQHCLIDLDEDGYKEPYIATIHKSSEKLLRLTANYDQDTIYIKEGDELVTLLEAKSDVSTMKIARIAPVSYFTKFPFIPSPDGGIYDLGFGQILIPIIETINTSINQMLDAGTLQNTGGGFVARGLITDKKGVLKFTPGEYKQVDNLTGGAIRDAIFNFEHRGPSTVTYSLLDRLIQVCQDMTTVQDIMVGGAQDQETATTTMSRVDQGMKLFTAIYKRLYRSLKEEFKKLKRLNKFYLPLSQYYRVLDNGILDQIGLADFQDDTDVQPIADPTIASLPLKLAKAQLLKQNSINNPLYNQREVERRFLEAMEITNVESLLIPEENMQPPPDPKLLAVQGQLEKINAEIEKMQVEKIEVGSKIMLNLANAAKAEVDSQFEQYRVQMELLAQEMEILKNASESQQGGAGAVAGESADTGSPAVSEGLPPAVEGEIGGGYEPQPVEYGANEPLNSETGGTL